MEISSIEVKEFRGLKDVTIKLGKYITVIAGHNMTGKSTILALLGHCSEVKRAFPLLKPKFSSDWSEIIKTDISETNYTRFAKVIFGGDINSDNPTTSIEYSTTKQAKEKRYRILPRHRNGLNNLNAKKVEWPVLYLGLSRLYPLGEDNKAAKISKQNKELQNYLEEIKNAYQAILNMNNDNIKTFETYDISVSTKKATGVETEEYKSWANSAGQDNLGQIITAVLSFKSLKEKQAEKWNGGLLLIDEIDATMHPFALQKLIDYLYQQSKEIGVQVVFTTHSITVLEYISAKTDYNNSSDINNYELNYISKANKIIKAYQDFSLSAIYYDLYSTTASKSKPLLISVYSEDEEARWFLRKILKPSYQDKVNLVDIKLGCAQLLDLLANDYDHFRNHLFVLDGDVKNEDIQNNEKRAHVKQFKNLIKLPGSCSPEKVLNQYICGIKGTHPIWEEKSLRHDGFTYDVITNTNGIQTYEGKEREKYKQWFKDNIRFFDVLIEFWINDNQNIINEFNDNFKNAYNYIAKISLRVNQLTE